MDTGCLEIDRLLETASGVRKPDPPKFRDLRADKVQQQVQDYLQQLSYNHTNVSQFFPINKMVRFLHFYSIRMIRFGRVRQVG
jgi:hypothetical protein